MSEDIILFIYLFPFWGIPTGMLIWFIVNLVRYLKCPKTEEKTRHSRKILMITTGIISALLWGGIIYIIVMFSIAMQHM